MVTIYVDDQCCGQISPMLHGQFIEVLGGCIYDGIWVGETSHIPNVKGIRKDFVEAMKKIAPPVIRWPGGMLCGYLSLAQRHRAQSGSAGDI